MFVVTAAVEKQCGVPVELQFYGKETFFFGCCCQMLIQHDRCNLSTAKNLHVALQLFKDRNSSRMTLHWPHVSCSIMLIETMLKPNSLYSIHQAMFLVVTSPPKICLSTPLKFGI